jgi:hypothetical protein
LCGRVRSFGGASVLKAGAYEANGPERERSSRK